MPFTDTQLVILSKASQREDGGVQLPATLKGGAARKVLDKLLSGGLIEEVPARGTLPPWRRDDEDRQFALRLTNRGRKSIRVGEEGTQEVAPSPPKKPSAATDPQRPVPRPRSPKAPAREPHPQSAPAGSKQEVVLGMLRSTAGTTIPAVMGATGWEAHSVRGFFAGVVRKKLGLDLLSEKVDGARVNRLAAGAA